MEPQKPEQELQRFYHQLLGPLSLFPPRKKTPPELPKPEKPQRQEESMLQSIPPAKLSVRSLCKQVSQLLSGSGLAARVPPGSRHRFIQVILNELRCSWREPPAEPSLSYANNQKLRKRLESYVLLCTEQLFLRYLHLLVTLSTPAGIFTESANLTRLAANLAHDCTLFLTGPNVYRSLLADFQALLQGGGTDKLRQACPLGAFKFCPLPWPHSTGFGQVPCSSLTLSYLIRLSRPPELLSEPDLDPVKELESIPTLKKRRPLRWLSTVTKKREGEPSLSQQEPEPRPSMTPTDRTSAVLASPPSLQLARGQSMPCLRKGWTLADELGLPPPPARPLTPLVFTADRRAEQAGDVVAEDLKQMMKNMRLERTRYRKVDLGLPLLLRVVTRRPAAGRRLEELQRKLQKGMEEEEEGASWQWDRQAPRSCPLAPQPVTVTLKMRNQVTVQVATVRLSDRNVLDTLQVEEAGVLYNHLADELDPKAIEDMDASHFVGSDIKEVYTELLSRVSTDHFRLDQGPLVEPAADRDWSAFLSSCTLRQDKRLHILNPKLACLYSRTAGSMEPGSRKTPTFKSSLAHKPWGKDAWADWWKNALSVDDYFKYLSSRETDFLHVLFHLYEEEAQVEEVVAAPVRRSPEIERPPPLVEEEEPDFVPGLWNWNTVLEHRLGVGKARPLAEPHKIPSLQKRLEQLWLVLEVPAQDQLKMAVKYSSNARLRQLPALVTAWEQALKPIRLREAWLGRLEWFERQASDPNRFFLRNPWSLGHLLEESQLRSYLHRKLQLLESSLTALLREIESAFGEPVTFRGRRYLDKMKQDKVEMLYWLQQRRRVGHLLQAQRVLRQSALLRRCTTQSLVVPENSPVAP
ncbi:coiled-coil domain-containing protein 87 [Ochotona curzoniae]|uniref:coiled-coil domain-containing protein 87 n=1 Tax=Ochotona curzoniae TaxID=130825 RepID=UPI001B3480E0|nr:coiled-coil domain-containing protein 87 [Ochotona curzoniae]